MKCVNELSVFRYKAKLEDPDGAVVTTFSAIELTLYDPSTEDIINGREAVDVLGVNGGDVDADGWFTWNSEVDDAEIVDDTKLRETRIAQFRFVWTGGQHYQEYEFQVRNLQQLPLSA